jgi:hypothetical protein
MQCCLLYHFNCQNFRLFSIPTSALRKGPLGQDEELPITLVGKKSSQGLGLALDPRDDTIFFSPVSETSIAAWNPVTNNQKYASCVCIVVVFYYVHSGLTD